ncbi:MAG: hypothetical protein ACD_82C00203G0002, partial [uncultured bacterium]
MSIAITLQLDRFASCNASCPTTPIPIIQTFSPICRLAFLMPCRATAPIFVKLASFRNCSLFIFA